MCLLGGLRVTNTEGMLGACLRVFCAFPSLDFSWSSQDSCDISIAGWHRNKSCGECTGPPFPYPTHVCVYFENNSSLVAVTAHTVILQSALNPQVRFGAVVYLCCGAGRNDKKHFTEEFNWFCSLMRPREDDLGAMGRKGTDPNWVLRFRFKGLWTQRRQITYEEQAISAVFINNLSQTHIWLLCKLFLGIPPSRSSPYTIHNQQPHCTVQPLPVCTSGL